MNRVGLCIGLITLVILLGIISVGEVNAKEGSHVWDESFGGSEEDWGRSIVEMENGDLVVAGDTRSYGSGNRDVWLIRTDSSGDEIWNHTFGDSRDDLAYNVINCSDGGLLISGYKGTGSTSKDNRDAWLIKTDGNGTVEWERTFGDEEQDEFRSAVEVGDGGFIATGTTQNYGNGEHDLWLLKVDPNGTEVWNRTYGWSDRDEGRDIRMAYDGGYIVAARGEPGGAGNLQFWLLKIDSSGKAEWNYTAGGSKMDEAWSAVETPTGGFIGVGRTYTHGQGGADLWLIKVDKDGDELWSRTYGGTEGDLGRYIVSTRDSHFAITGRTSSYGADDFNVWLLKVDVDGSEKINTTFGGSQWDEGRGIRQLDDGSYVITGRTRSFGQGMSDAWLIKAEGPEVPNAPPTVIIQSPADRATAEYLLNISGTTFDPDGNETVVSVEASMNNGSWTEINGTSSWWFVWNATVLPEGTYLLSFRAFDGRNHSEASKLLVRSANHAPFIEIEEPKDGSNASGIVSIRGYAIDIDGPEEIVAVDMAPPGEAWRPVNGLQVWNVTWNSTVAGPGTHLLSFRTFDGEVFSETVNLTLTIVNRKPVVEVKSHTNHSEVSGDVIIKGTASDPDGSNTIAFVEASLDFGPWHAFGGARKWEYPWNTTETPDGEHSLRFRAYDGILNSSVAELIIGVNNTQKSRPTVVATAPSNHSSVFGIVNITGHAHDPDGPETLQAIEISIGGEPWTPANGTADWWYLWNTSSYSNGPATIMVRAYDGESYSDIIDIEVAIHNQGSNTPPEVSLSFPLPGSGVHGVIIIEGLASDVDGNDTIVYVEVSVAGGNWSIANGTVNWTFVWNTTEVVDGLYELRFRAHDGVLDSQVLSVALNVMNNVTDQRPQVVIVEPVSGSKVSGMMHMEGTAFDPEDNLLSVQVSIDNGPWAIASGLDNWTFHVDTTLVGDGAHTISVRAFDGTSYSNVPVISILVENGEIPEPPKEEPKKDDDQLDPAPIMITGIIILLVAVYIVWLIKVRTK